jgi:large subunit ribosomal protein L22
MKITAETKAVTISPRKVRLIADSVRKLPLTKALSLLMMTQKRAARPLYKTMKSAVANAVNNNHVSEDSLRLFAIEVMEGPAMKRFHASTRGRIHPYIKQTSHVRIILESVEQPKVAKVATKKKVQEDEEE